MKMQIQCWALLVLGAIIHPALALWPMPRTLQAGTTLVKLSPAFKIDVGVAKPPQDLLDAVSRTTTRLRTDNLQRLVVGRASADSAALTHAPSITKLTLTLTPAGAGAVKSIMTEATKDIAERSESYSLTLPSNGGAASIVANSTLGLFRGLTTFEQLWYADASGNPYAYQAPLTISNDSPAFASVVL
jgi:hexosaminidase